MKHGWCVDLPHEFLKLREVSGLGLSGRLGILLCYFDLHVKVFCHLQRAVILKQVLVLIFGKGDEIEVSDGIDIELANDEWINCWLRSFVEV